MTLYAIIYYGTLFIFLLTAGVICFKNKNAGKIYWVYGKNIAAIFIILEISVFLIKNINTIVLFTIVPLNFILISVFITAGMILSKKLHLPSIPLIKAVTRGKKELKNIKLVSMIISIIIGSVFVCLFTAILFLLTKPGLSEFMQKTVIQPDKTAPETIAKTTILFFILIAVYEEIIFRQFIQRLFSWLMKGISGGWLLSIIITSTLFALGHVGILSAAWVKFFQTFVIGIVLGLTMRKFGLEASICVHSILNIFALYSSNYLLG